MDFQKPAVRVESVQHPAVLTAAGNPETRPGSEAALPDASRFSWAVCGLIAALISAVYAASLHFDFVYDDRVQILNNPWLSSWRFIPRYFSDNAAAFTGNSGGAFWRPFFLLWLLANRALFGFHPWGWHLTTVALHAVAACLVYALARRILRCRFSAAWAALLFGVYPAAVESVAWVSGCTDSLLAVFLLAAFLVYLRAREVGSRIWATLSLTLFAFSLLVKETAVVLPVLIFAHAWVFDLTGQYPGGVRESPGGWKIRRTLRPAFPYLVIMTVYLVERGMILAGAESISAQLPIRTMLLTAPSLLWFYLRLLVFPLVLSPHYNLGPVAEFNALKVVLPAVELIVLGIACGLIARRFQSDARRRALFALAAIVIPILPVLYIRPLAADDFVHVRYLYLSTIGLALLAGTVMEEISTRIRPRGASSSQWPAWAGSLVSVKTLCALALLAVCAGFTSRAKFYWRDNFTLFEHSARVAPDNSRALTDYAVELGERKRYPEAIANFERALVLNPQLWYAHVDLGYTYYIVGRYLDAEHSLWKGIALNPEDPNQYTFLAAAQIKSGKMDEAEQSMRTAISLAPALPNYHFALGLILEREGRREEAQKEFISEIEVNPRNADARARIAEPAQ
jgi:tetratricopeptide (TPR) repeat protein